MAKIFLFRHGQTDYNVKGIFCGWMDDAELTEDGINECKGIAEKLKDVKPTKGQERCGCNNRAKAKGKELRGTYRQEQNRDGKELP
jgi:broad specificity phosphatase PhoE